MNPTPEFLQTALDGTLHSHLKVPSAGVAHRTLRRGPMPAGESSAGSRRCRAARRLRAGP